MMDMDKPIYIKGLLDYKEWLSNLKSKIRSTQIKAALAVNTELIGFYWDLGKMITEKQTDWGTSFLEQLSKDLKAEFPNMNGLSFRNLNYCRQFYQFYTSSIVQQVVAQLQPTDKNRSQQATGLIWLQLVAQIPWGHNILIFSKSANTNEALFYIQKTIKNGWSRAVLTLQIESGLYQRQGKAITNFKNTLPENSSDLAHQLLKDPYQFDFLTLTENYKECELENALVENITSKNKNNIIVEYALKNINQPIGVSEYELTKQFPEQFRSSLPTIEEIENELKSV